MARDTEGVNRRTFLTVSGSVLGGMAVGSTVVAAERTDRFIVDTNGVRGRDLERAVDVVHDLEQVDLAVVEGDSKDLEGVTRTFEPDIEIDLGEPEANAESPTVEAAGVADEPLYPFQWDKQALDVPTAHQTTRGEGTRVAIVDTGVAAGHPDLEVNEALSRNFTGDGLGAANAAGGYHGTHVGGIVGASDDAQGVIGTAPETELVDCRVFSPLGDGGASFGDILAAITYSAAIGADAANVSIGAYPVSRRGIGQFYGKALNRTTTWVNRQGTLLVVSAGNDGADLQHDKHLISLPNEAAQALSVAATGPVGFAWEPGDYGDEAPPESPAIYTNYGTNAVDLAAPGGDTASVIYRLLEEDEPVPAVPWYNDLVLNTTATPIFGTDDQGDPAVVGHDYSYGWVSGTSMAAPQVAGAAALVKSEHPRYNANQVESALQRAADVPGGYEKAYYGSGFLNVVDAL